MLDVELAASMLNLYSSDKIKLITITGGPTGEGGCSKSFQRNNKHTFQLSIKNAPRHHLYLVCIFLVVRLIKRAIAIEQNNLHSNWKTKGLDTDPIQRMSNTGHH